MVPRLWLEPSGEGLRRSEFPIPYSLGHRGAGGMSFTHVSMGQQVRPVGEVVLPNQSTRWEEVYIYHTASNDNMNLSIQDQYLWQFKSNTRPLELLWVVKDGMLTVRTSYFNLAKIMSHPALSAYPTLG